LPPTLTSQPIETLDSLLRQATVAGQVPGFENEYVRVTYTLLEYGTGPERAAPGRPVLLYVRVQPSPGRLNARPLLPPRGAAPVWRPGVVPRAVEIELRAPPPPPMQLGAAGTEPPRGTIEEKVWDGGRLLVATYRPLDYSVGAGPYPSVTTFVSDGVVEVSSRGLRRRMAVQAGDAFWFEAGTRITVVDDYPVGAAIVQLIARR
jgi:hypothetical protein